MLDYAVKLTLTPWKVGEGDVERLREVGFDPAAILDICQAEPVNDNGTLFEIN